MSRAISLIVDELAVAVVEQGASIDEVASMIQSAIEDELGSKLDREEGK